MLRIRNCWTNRANARCKSRVINSMVRCVRTCWMGRKRLYFSLSLHMFSIRNNVYRDNFNNVCAFSKAIYINDITNASTYPTIIIQSCFSLIISTCFQHCCFPPNGYFCWKVSIVSATDRCINGAPHRHVITMCRLEFQLLLILQDDYLAGQSTLHDYKLDC